MGVLEELAESYRALHAAEHAARNPHSLVAWIDWWEWRARRECNPDGDLVAARLNAEMEALVLARPELWPVPPDAA